MPVQYHLEIVIDKRHVESYIYKRIMRDVFEHSLQYRYSFVFLYIKPNYIIYQIYSNMHVLSPRPLFVF